MKKAFTLLELIITVMMLVILVGVSVYLFRTVLISWSGEEVRTGIGIDLDRAVEDIARELREAREIRSTDDYDEIRFTKDGVTYYIYYLYNSNDSYIQPPAFNQDFYELRKATLVGAIDGSFAYGSGRLIATDLLPPITSDLSFDSGTITIDLSIARGDETIRSRTEVTPRNL